MIPKLIHYCWFGRGEQPDSVKKCISTWEKACPDFKIICWNEDNYDVNVNKYVKQAYAAKKWAFVTDYARLEIIYKYGGIYLDTDVELLKSLLPLLENKIYMGLDRIKIEEQGEFWVNTGLGFGAEKGNKMLLDFMKLYDDKLFINESNIFDLTPTPIIMTNYLKNLGFVDENKIQYINDLIIYPTEYFAPKNFITQQIDITNNTYSIHHYDNSWNEKLSKIDKLKNSIKSVIRKLFLWKKIKKS
ncbi:glycosyltransferase family 32 protein [Catenibacterium mitsuokai]|uniref:glycosyltransferase family 32 protein n=1 Tax=Catenibacterium mitsuokai TaxID=100886 RepID=UPI003F90B34F